MLGDMIKKYSASLKKVVHVSGLLGAGIIFASSFINDHFVTAFQEDTQNLDAVENDEAQIQSSTAAAEDQLKAAQRMIDLQIEVNELSKKTPIEKAKNVFDAASVYLDTLESSVDILTDSVTQISEISQRVKLSEESKKTIEGLDAEIKTVSETMKAENATFKKLNEEFKSVASASRKEQNGLRETSLNTSLNKLASFQDNDADDAEGTEESDKPAGAAGAAGAENAQPPATSGDGTRGADQVLNDIVAQMDKLEALGKEYEETSEKLNEFFDKLDAEVTQEKQKSESVSDTVSYLAYALSILGAALAGFGKFLEGRLSGSSLASDLAGGSSEE